MNGFSELSESNRNLFDVVHWDLFFFLKAREIYSIYFVYFSSEEYGVTEEEKRLIIEEHNYLRQTVANGQVHGQPAAQNMQEIRWDDELASKAQQWANQCTFQHDPSRYLGEFWYAALTANNS